MLDLRQREVLWTDIALQIHLRFTNTVRGNLTGVSLMLRALCVMVKPAVGRHLKPPPNRPWHT